MHNFGFWDQPLTSIMLGYLIGIILSFFITLKIGKRIRRQNKKFTIVDLLLITIIFLIFYQFFGFIFIDIFSNFSPQSGQGGEAQAWEAFSAMLLFLPVMIGLGIVGSSLLVWLVWKSPKK